MEKKPFLKHWSNLRASQKLSPKPVRYTHEGSTYAEDGVRITGSKAFVDSVLSRLKDLLRYEGEETRLQVVYKKSTDRESGKTLTSYNCYVQVHARGGVKKADAGTRGHGVRRRKNRQGDKVTRGQGEEERQNRNLYREGAKDAKEAL